MINSSKSGPPIHMQIVVVQHLQHEHNLIIMKIVIEWTLWNGWNFMSIWWLN